MASEKAVYLDASVRGGDDVARVLGHLEAAAVAVHEWLASECARQGFGETPNPIVPQ